MERADYLDFPKGAPKWNCGPQGRPAQVFRAPLRLPVMELFSPVLLTFKGLKEGPLLATEGYSLVRVYLTIVSSGTKKIILYSCSNFPSRK